MTASLLQTLIGLAEPAALALIRGRLHDVDHQPGAFVWARTTEGRRVEVLFDLAGKVAAAGVVSPALAAQASEARSCWPADATPERLRRSQPLEHVEDLLDRLVGNARTDLVHLGTRLARGGGQARAYGLPCGGVIEVLVDPAGRCRTLGSLAGFAAYHRRHLRADVDWAVPEKHKQPYQARSWGDAYAHARLRGGSVLSIRERYDDDPQITLLCESPADPDGAWFPRFADDGPPPIGKFERFTRAYTLTDRRDLRTAWLGHAASQTDAARWGLFAHTLTQPRPNHALSEFDRALAVAVLLQLHGLLVDGEGAIADEHMASGLAQRIKKLMPQYFTRQGLTQQLESQGHTAPLQSPANSPVSPEPAAPELALRPAAVAAAPHAAPRLTLRIRRSLVKTFYRALTVLVPVTLASFALMIGGFMLTGNIAVGALILLITWVPGILASGPIIKRIDFRRDGEAEPIRLYADRLVIPSATPRTIALQHLRVGAGFFHQPSRYNANNPHASTAVSSGVFLHLMWGDENLVLVSDDGYGSAPDHRLKRYPQVPTEWDLVHVWTEELLPLIVALTGAESS